MHKSGSWCEIFRINQMSAGNDAVSANIMLVDYLSGGGELEGVHDPDDLVKVAAGGRGVQQGQLQPAVRPDHEHGPVQPKLAFLRRRILCQLYTVKWTFSVSVARFTLRLAILCVQDVVPHFI